MGEDKKIHKQCDINNILLTCENIMLERNNTGGLGQEQGFKCTYVGGERSLEEASLKVITN